MSKVVVSGFSKVRKLRAFRSALGQCCPNSVTDLAFVQQSHNAVVFRGQFEGQPAYFKAYDGLNGRDMAQSCIDEIESVAPRMVGYRGGIAPLLWASVSDGIVATGAVPGQLVIDALGVVELDKVMGEVGLWLRSYVGDTAFEDQFSTAYWVRQRLAVDLGHLIPRDRHFATSLLAHQAERAEQMGTVRAWKGQAPRDFAPWNLHWHDGALWGFDMEGHFVKSLAQMQARFCVLVLEQVDTSAAVETLAGQVQSAFGDCEDAPGLMSFVVGDVLFERFLKWADHGVKGPRLRRAIEAYLTSGR